MPNPWASQSNGQGLWSPQQAAIDAKITLREQVADKGGDTLVVSNRDTIKEGLLSALIVQMHGVAPHCY